MLRSVSESPQQARILALLLECYQTREIGERLGIATRTVKAHFHRIFLLHGITGGVKRVKLARLFLDSTPVTDGSCPRFSGKRAQILDESSHFRSQLFPLRGHSSKIGSTELQVESI